MTKKDRLAADREIKRRTGVSMRFLWDSRVQHCYYAHVIKLYTRQNDMDSEGLWYLMKYGVKV